MKRLSLDETWRLCLSMWRWIAKEVRAGNGTPVGELKEQWMESHGFGKDEIYCDCFFCHYTQPTPEYCPNCPAVQVDANFSCADDNHWYRSCPIPFYNKLVSLNRKRLKDKAHKETVRTLNKQR